MNRTVKKALLMLFLFLSQYCMAQTESVFKLTQEHGISIVRQP